MDRFIFNCIVNFCSSFKFIQVRDRLRKAILVLEKYIATTDTLTTQLWPGFPAHKWTTKKFDSQSVFKFRVRMEEVLELRIVVDQISSLLPVEKVPKNPFIVFGDVDALNCSAFYEARWKV